MIRLKPLNKLLTWSFIRDGTNKRRFYTKQKNIILLGSPGCGKTTVGRILGIKLGLPVIDIESDYLENTWKMPVAQKLSEVGIMIFLKEESKAMMNFETKQQTVISLTCSNPLHVESFSKISKSGVVVFLDVSKEDILKRATKMKVSRISGFKEEIALKEILNYRQTFYEKFYDVRIICEENEDPFSISEKIFKTLNKLDNPFGYVSTRHTTQSGLHQGHMDFKTTLVCGLAKDGGLFVAEEHNFPALTPGQWKRLVGLPYNKIASRILEQWIHPSDLIPQTLNTYIENSYKNEIFSNEDVISIKHLTDNQYILELFHGPTASCKDCSLQLMSKLFLEAVQQDTLKNKKYVILVATSGDTGSAVIDGFSKLESNGSLGVMVLYPKDGVSKIQKKLMINADRKNVHVIEVDGDFDFCQKTVKNIFQNKELKDLLESKYNLSLSAANSINWGMLLPQVVHHIAAYLNMVKKNVICFGDPVNICIPTGNFGNVLAAYYSKKMGIPFQKIICANNENNIITDFMKTGCYFLHGRSLLRTISPSIDILMPSNLERYLYHISGNSTHLVKQYNKSLKDRGCFQVNKEILNKIQSDMYADWCSEEDCLDTILTTYKTSGYLLDTHTAVAKVVADRYQKSTNSNEPMIIASTAHYMKFGDTILPTILQDRQHFKELPLTDMMEIFKELQPSPKPHSKVCEMIKKSQVHYTVCKACENTIKNELLKFVASLS
ncbi:threonine synthase-like 1 isoform X1 [Octopus sinensis]|uniref:Threonine synthase-like 1 isoform X1 n=1 Tax=Octopus sinensis TaxID=2607531 RepID=A0A6P7S5V5_9MOLL|nr:threonine synthase-like 1 isoform X1 [Octopus sinensis]XP_036357151.1 threonine synthase-like 1 isoform X1 [Octopus sinensis]